MEKRIGVFDSGLGGLSVFKELVIAMPNENYYVFGDTKNVPYGDKTSERIAELTSDAFNKLNKLGLKAFVIACNTATAHGLDSVKEIADVPVIGVINPGVDTAIQSGCNDILVLATEATINSGIIQTKLAEQKPELNIEGLACPEMVIIVENGDYESDHAKDVVYKYLDQAKIEPDCVMLACTHFPFLQDHIVSYYEEKGIEIEIVNPAAGCAEKIRSILEENGNLITIGEGKADFFVSGSIDKYKETGNRMLGKEVIIDIDQL